MWSNNIASLVSYFANVNVISYKISLRSKGFKPIRLNTMKIN